MILFIGERRLFQNLIKGEYRMMKFLKKVMIFLVLGCSLNNCITGFFYPSETPGVLRTANKKCSKNIYYIFPNFNHRECYKEKLLDDFDHRLIYLELVKKDNKIAYIESLQNLEKAYLYLSDYYKIFLESAKQDAENSTRNRLLITFIGLASTAAATVLATASPANAPTVAGLGALSTGVITYQGVLAEEGKTRDSLLRVHDLMQKKRDSIRDSFVENLEELYDLGYSLEKKCTNDPVENSKNKRQIVGKEIDSTDSNCGEKQAKFFTGYAKLKIAIYDLFIYAYKIPSYATESEIAKFNELTKKGIDAAEQSIKKLSEKKNSKDPKKEDAEKTNLKIREILRKLILDNYSF